MLIMLKLSSSQLLEVKITGSASFISEDLVKNFLLGALSMLLGKTTLEYPLQILKKLNLL